MEAPRLPPPRHNTYLLDPGEKDLCAEKGNFPGPAISPEIAAGKCEKAIAPHNDPRSTCIMHWRGQDGHTSHPSPPSPYMRSLTAPPPPPPNMVADFSRPRCAAALQGPPMAGPLPAPRPQPLAPSPAARATGPHAPRGVSPLRPPTSNHGCGLFQPEARSSPPALAISTDKGVPRTGRPPSPRHPSCRAPRRPPPRPPSRAPQPGSPRCVAVGHPPPRGPSGAPWGANAGFYRTAPRADPA